MKIQYDIDEAPTLIILGHNLCIFCQHCLTLRLDIVAIPLEASDAVIVICPICVYEIYLVPAPTVWTYV